MNKKVALILFFLTIACSRAKQDYLLSIVDKKHTGVDFQNTLRPTDSLNILDYLYYYNGGGVAVGDINNDNLVDVFFTSNQGKNKLYLNKGNFVFEDITDKAGVEGASDWNTGTVMADVNGDGFLDIYVCAVVGIHGLKGANELFINNGNGTFSEQATKYNLSFKNYSTTVSFFDYDNDGDLDMYLLNHAIHSQNSFGKADIRYKRDLNSGDKLLRNDGGSFTDVSEEAGIFGGANGYGLGIATQDFNNDGFVDLYISNDFHEDDYYYLNNGNGTFTEKLKSEFGKTSRFSMGSDVADLNHDGLTDILTLDMAPEDETVLKSSMGDETVDMLNLRTKNLGYHYQYTRNMLQINTGENFSEMALFSGLSATDWSWSALFGDFNQDGEQDVFISNGIPKRPNDLDYIKFTSNEEIKESLKDSRSLDKEVLKLMPSGAVANRIYEGNKNLSFKDQSGNWISNEALISTGSAYADFDNDGDLDIVTNNINTPASFYKNNIDSTAHYLKLKLRYKKGNSFGIGTKVISYHNGIKQYKQLFNSKGFQSSSEPVIHFGYGAVRKVDSITIIWPDNTFQTVEDIKTNQTLKITALSKRFPFDYSRLLIKTRAWLTKVDSIKGLRFRHKENNFIDFNLHKLIPYQVSDRGPATAIGDLNNDGKQDIFFGSSRNQPSQLFIQTNDGFIKKDLHVYEENKLTEDVSATIADFNKDGQNDLFVATGGGEFYNEAKPIQDILYQNNGNLDFEKAQLPHYFGNASVVKAIDVDNDGDLDLFVGNHVDALNFGKLPDSYFLINEKNNFTLKLVEKLGMVTDAITTDFNRDGQTDIIAVGEWMHPVFLLNNHGTFKDVTSKIVKGQLNGLWQSIAAFDIDNDGDDDYILGNFGLNSKFKATNKFPMKMYVGDFDNNKSIETIVVTEKNGKYYTQSSLDELAGQLNYLKKKYTSYKDFAGQTVEDIFGDDVLNEADLLTVNTLASGYLENTNGAFSFQPFKNVELQLAPITEMLENDFNADGKTDILLAGNYFGISPFHGKFDSFSGAVLQNNGQVVTSNQLGIDFYEKVVRGLNSFTFKGRNYLLVTINNDEIEIYEIRS
ncbi:VCBS repeat-containing protein [Gaetbulibacter sp. M240]|uniref:VCBS repeat-containing protein n=1 Tax=Gaetbulibacter sp. M240 TaxID=3126511 RepID=UPI00374FD0D4